MTVARTVTVGGTAKLPTGIIAERTLALVKIRTALQVLPVTVAAIVGLGGPLGHIATSVVRTSDQQEK